MANVLTKDTDIKNKGVQFYTDYLVDASQTIYKGAIVMIESTTGLLVVGADTASAIPVGIADEAVTSTTAGVKKCRVASGGLFYLVTGTLTQITGSTKTMCVVDTGSVDLASVTTNDIKLGRVVYWLDGTHSWVYIPPFGATAI